VPAPCGAIPEWPPTTEDRVDRLEALLGQFVTQMAVINKAAEERLARFKPEMREFKDEMRFSKREMDEKWGALANKLGTIIGDILAPT
jgi:hypothetical protein